MMAELPKKLIQKLEKRRQEGSLRTLPLHSDLVDFSSNDYLGFARNAEIAKHASTILQTYQHTNGSTGSRLLTGNHPLYSELERTIANFHEAAAALVFNSGYDANMGFFSSVPQRGDVVFYDELIHASIRDGLQMSNAKSFKFAHNNIEDLSRQIGLNRNVKHESEIYVVTESIFSMDGDTPDLKKLATFCKSNQIHLIVDEAHAVGIFGDGKGWIPQLGLQKDVFARVVTFGKALGCHGAAILGNEALKKYLVNFSRSLIYTTALSPHSLATILASYTHLMKSGGEARRLLEKNIQQFKGHVHTLNLGDIFIESNSVIHCAVLSGNERVRQIAHGLQEQGYEVKPILSPTVKAGLERLRFCLHSYTTEEEIFGVLSSLKQLLEQ